MVFYIKRLAGSADFTVGCQRRKGTMSKTSLKYALHGLQYRLAPRAGFAPATAQDYSSFTGRIGY
jgi:hypothetical protein